MSMFVVRWRQGLAAFALLLGSGMVSAQPQPWKTIEAATIDDPVVALQIAQGALQRASGDHDVDAEFWALLAQARVLISLEDSERRQVALTQARGRLDQLHGNASQAQLWLDIVQALSDVRENPNRVMVARLEALRQRASALGRNDLLCEVEAIDMWSMLASGSSDESWNAAQASYQCAAREKLLGLELDALTQLGSLASRVGGRAAEDNETEDYLQRALARLHDQPARFQRSLIEYEFGTALAARQRSGAAAFQARVGAQSRTARPGRRGCSADQRQRGPDRNRRCRFCIDDGPRSPAVDAATRQYRARRGVPRRVAAGLDRVEG